MVYMKRNTALPFLFSATITVGNRYFDTDSSYSPHNQAALNPSLKLVHGHVFARNVLGDVAANLASRVAEELLAVDGLGRAASEEPPEEAWGQSIGR